MTEKEKKQIREIIKIGDTTYLKEGYGPKARKIIFDNESTGKLISAISNKFLTKFRKKVYI